MAQVKQCSNLKTGIPQLAAVLDKYRPENAEFYFELAVLLDCAGSQSLNSLCVAPAGLTECFYRW
jgi:hypothetical protein